MKTHWIAAMIVAAMELPVSAQISLSYTAPAPPPRPTIDSQAGAAGPTTPGDEFAAAILWDQTDFGLTAWLDQVFTDFPTSSSFDVADISTGGATWRVDKVTTYFTQGVGGSWSPGTVTMANLQVYSKTGSLPSDGIDIAPEYTVPVTLVDNGGFTWNVEADTTGITELQCVTGDFWIGLTPITNYGSIGQEYHWSVSSVSNDSALRNPGGAFGLGAGWTGLGSVDTIGAGGPYEGAITLEGAVLAETWVDLGPGTGLLSAFWGDVPFASGTGFACDGNSLTVSVFHAGPPFSLTNMVIGYTAINAPFKGGTMVPDMDVILYSLPTGANGDIALPTIWPSGVPAGFTLSMQFWQNEPPWSATNGLQVTSQ